MEAKKEETNRTQYRYDIWFDQFIFHIFKSIMYVK